MKTEMMKVEVIKSQDLEVGDQIIVTGQDGNCGLNKPNGSWIANITTKDIHGHTGYTKVTLYFHEHDSKTTVYPPDEPVIVIRSFI